MQEFPEFAARLDLAPQVTSQQAVDGRRVDVTALPKPPRSEDGPQTALKTRFTKPVVLGCREPDFALSGADRFRQNPLHGPSQEGLGFAVPDEVLGSQRQGSFEHLVVQEGKTRLEGEPHRGAVGPDQKVLELVLEVVEKRLAQIRRPVQITDQQVGPTAGGQEIGMQISLAAGAGAVLQYRRKQKVAQRLQGVRRAVDAPIVPHLAHQSTPPPPLQQFFVKEAEKVVEKNCLIQNISKSKKEGENGEYIGISKFSANGSEKLIDEINIISKENINSSLIFVIDGLIKKEEKVSAYNIGKSNFVDIDFPDDLKKDLALVSACIGGAATVEDTENMLKQAGFQKISITPKEIPQEIIDEFIPDNDINDYVISAYIQAQKPGGNSTSE